MQRQPAVADRFYPGEKHLLESTVRELFAKANPRKRQNVLGVVSPHAGYVYSGHVAAEVIGAIDIPETVVILGPNHHGQGPSISVSRKDWQMPSGVVPIDTEFSDMLREDNTDVTADNIAHHQEHSLEVQVPFLQVLQPKLSIIPLALSQLPYPTCEKLAISLAKTIRNYPKPVLLLASSDMSHYVPRQKASKMDDLALAQLKELNPEGLYNTVLSNRISMCGIIPVTIMLKACLLLGANSAEVIRYTDSGEVSGDTDQVVGYAGAVISRT